MRTTTPDELSQEERAKIYDFLSRFPVGVLATVNSDSTPHASTLYCTTDSNLNITFTTKRDTRKHENLLRSNAVMLAFYDAASQTTVQVNGSAIEEVDPDVAQDIYHAIAP